jgi:hypothetical protein
LDNILHCCRRKYSFSGRDSTKCDGRCAEGRDSKAKKKPDFDRFSADKLTLYLVDFLEHSLAEIVKQPLTIETLTPLMVTKQVGALLPNGPARETVQILVQVPTACK